MKYLLDTHYLIWAITETSKLSKNVKIIIENPKNTILVSAISFWEISLKFSLGKLDLGPLQPENFQTACEQMGCEILDLNAETSSTYHQLLPKYHKDPFDRMLIWQAIKNNYTLISDDVNVQKYITEGLKVIS
jgi:PIN domain nuclease of toxin-antitoxin system